MPDTALPNKILIAGIGNIFQGDDAFGSEVASKLAKQSWPAGVCVMDAGIRSIDLVYALMDDYDLRILIDATTQGGKPGTLYTIQVEMNDLPDSDTNISLPNGHTMNPMTVLRTVRAMGGSCERIVLVGCEPLELGGEEGCMGLSEPVIAAVDAACRVVESLVENFLTARLPLPRQPLDGSIGSTAG